jgi:enamine deaminase RidA (YjgF/YER057c/UK114 family)
MNKRHQAVIPVLAVGLAIAAGSCNVEVNRDSEERTKMEKEFMNLPHLPKPSGYTHVVTSPPGKLIFLSGQGGAGEDGQLPDDFATQTENTFKNIQKALEMAGASFDDVVKMGYFVTDVTKLEEVRAVRSNYINMDNPPASTLVQAPLIGNLLIEIDVIAVVPE